MKKTLRLLMALAVLLTGLGASAAVTSRDLGYVSSTEDIWDYTGFSNPGNTNANWSVAIRLTKEEIGKYIGGSLVGMKIGWDSRQKSEPVTFWIRTAYENENLASGTATLNFGWNTVKFSSPYVIPDDVDEIWFGYDLIARPGDYCIATSTLNNKTTDVCYIVNRDIYESDPQNAIADVCRMGEDFCMILATLTLEVDPTNYQNMVRLTGIKHNPMVTDESPATALLSLKNEGMNNITKVTLSYKMGEMTYGIDIPLSQALKQNATTSISAPVPGLGSGTMEITMPKVNGADNKINSTLTTDIITIPADVAIGYERRSLLEYFVSENEFRVPVYFNSYLNPIYQKYADNMTLVCRHLDDQYQIGDNEDLDLLVNLYGNQLGYVSLPSMALDRSMQLGNQASIDGCVAYNTLIPDEMTGMPHVSGIVSEALNTPTFAGLEVESDYNFANNDGFVNIEVNGEIAEGILPEGENLKLSVYLIENNVYSTSQEFKANDNGTVEKGEFWHQALIRQQPTEIFGDVIEGDGNFSRSYKVEIDPEWKPADMKIVAMLSRSEANNIYHRNVVNCAEAAFDPGMTAIKKVTGTEGTTFEVVAGSVLANGSAEGVEVFTIAGARVANNGLAAGVYVVRHGTEVAKICVK